MRAMKSVLIVTRMGYSFRATRINIEYEPYTETELYPGSHQGRKICLCAQLKICPRVWLVERRSRSSGMAGKDPGL